MKFIILSTNQELICSLKRYLKYLHSIKSEEVKSFLIRNPEKEAYQNFLIIRSWLEGLFENDAIEMKHTLAFLDLPLVDCSAILGSGNSAGGLLSMLYLAFPEIYWFLLTPIEEVNTDECLDSEAFEHFHVLKSGKPELNLDTLVEKFLHGYTTMFDPSGFRGHIVKQTLHYMNQTGEDILSERPFSCKREKKALIVDEELGYSFLHSYVGYKMGYRAMLVSTKSILDAVSKLQEKEEKNAFDISFEDICLSFPDHKITNDLADREEEDEQKKGGVKYYFFQRILKRIFITIGEKKELKQKNREYRKKLKAAGKLDFYKILYKPYAGIFNLIKSAKLKSRKIKLKSPKIESVTGHSAPGRFGMIADCLINRCKRVLNQANSSIDAVYAAMLALQAQEILGGRTATLSIESISLKHQAEVKAECMFYGVEHNFDVKSRFKEIEKELEIIGKWFNKSTRDIMIFNSELNIINELARVFRQYSQFDEEQSCLNRVRSISRKIYFKRNKFWGWLISPLRWYFEFLVGSLARFLAAIILWPTLFTFIYYFISDPGNRDALKNAFIYSINSFFALQVTTNNGFSQMPSLLAIIPILLGFFHLGIFISHLYTIVSRR